jgi:site-specific recombinase XerD
MKLSKVVTTYVVYKQSLGMRFTTEARTLKSFYTVIGDVEMDQIQSDQVSKWLTGNGPITSFYHRKLDAIRGLYRFALARGYTSLLPLPKTVPRRPPAFIPYIYSRDEIKRLLEATSDRSVRCVLSPLTCRTLLLLLYGTGLRISEALSLDLADVDLQEGILCIRESKFYKSRLVPVGNDLKKILEQYAIERNKRPPRTLDAPFLLTQRGTRVSCASAESTFRRLCERAQVRRDDHARYQPRLHDIRHYFAVTRLISWYRDGEDVQRLLPQLATYLGHVNIVNTQRYLTMTPELLREAGARFERFAMGGHGHG